MSGQVAALETEGTQQITKNAEVFLDSFAAEPCAVVLH